MARGPNVIVIGGPNGAGKTTSAPTLLRNALDVKEFVNADPIAQGLSGLDPDAAAIAAGRVMLARLRELAHRRVDFAFESTLASRSFAPWLRRLREDGYSVHVLFLWLPSAEMAVARVRERVRLGGHDVPESTVRRRFERGLGNFFSLYRPLADSWAIYDNLETGAPRLIAKGGLGASDEVLDADTWKLILAEAGAA